ncbi:DUF1707 domain-containing protein [Streptosporangium sp. NPDC023615]|uniref:DUF1707 SHOCT-like domain-containing protein n=1 Tax=Streptosporangium sp. NPDC023615 TaxID=3154794 RepID=UPI00341DAB68
MTDHVDIRAGDADRERIAETLRVAVTEGRISLEELNERLDRTYEARTCGELDAIVADLPRAGGPPVSLPGVPDLLRLEAQNWQMVRQEGYWVVPPRINAIARQGSVRIDFTGAECAWPEIFMEVSCDARSSGIMITVPGDWQVRSDEVLVAGWGGVYNRPSAPTGPAAVTLRLTGRTDGHVWVRYRRRRT